MKLLEGHDRQSIVDAVSITAAIDMKQSTPDSSLSSSASTINSVSAVLLPLFQLQPFRHILMPLVQLHLKTVLLLSIFMQIGPC